MARESAYEAQSFRPVGGLDVYRLLSPSERQCLGDAGSAVALHEGDEINQSLACVLQLEPQTAAQTQVFLNGLSKRVHRTPPGHGKASVRNALMSTLV
jgi:hypothetical protein